MSNNGKQKHSIYLAVYFPQVYAASQFCIAEIYYVVNGAQGISKDLAEERTEVAWNVLRKRSMLHRLSSVGHCAFCRGQIVLPKISYAISECIFY